MVEVAEHVIRKLDPGWYHVHMPKGTDDDARGFIDALRPFHPPDVHFIVTIGEMTIDKVDEEAMRQYGWVRIDHGHTEGDPAAKPA